MKKNKLLFYFIIQPLLLTISTITFAQNPVITSFTPATVCQGDLVTITGTNFTGTTNVKLGSLPALSFQVKDATTITAYTNEKAVSGVIIITTPKGTDTSITTLTIKTAPVPALNDISNPNNPFANCDGNLTYQLIVQNNSDQVATQSTYDIDWGDGTAHFNQKDWAAGAQTQHTYNAQGFFKIVFKIMPANNCTKTVIYNFYSGANPLASLTTTTSTTGLCVPATIIFKVGNWFNNSAGTSYTLDFGDGNDTTLYHPLNSGNTDKLISHTYTTSSCPIPFFKANLNVTNGCLPTNYTLDQIVIRQKPKADFSFSLQKICVNDPVCFTNLTQDGYSGAQTCTTDASYIWDFGDGSPVSTSKTPPCHAYAAAGTYNIKLSASNAACGSDEITKTIIVQPVSTTPSVSANSVNYCQYATASPLSATGTGLLWYTSATGGVGSTTAPTPSTNTPGITVYYVSQTQANKCESPRVAITVNIYGSPAAPGVTTPVQLCKGDAATPLTATGNNLLWYLSASGGAGTPTAPTPSTAVVGTTAYYVSQKVNNCESPRAKIEVIVSEIPAKPTVVSPVIYCQNQPAVPLTAPGTGLLWYTAASGGTGTTIAPTPSTATPGTTSYYVSAGNYCGESGRSNIQVIVNPGPSATIGYAKNVLCNVTNISGTPNPPIPVILTGSAGGSFSISPSTGLSIDALTGTIKPSGATPGTYTIKYSIAGSGGCPVFTTTTTVTITGSPFATVNYPLMCTSDAAENVQLNGTQGGSFSSTAGLTINASTGTISPSASSPGNYIVTYTVPASAPCPGFTTTTNVTITKAPSASITYGVSNLCNVVNTAGTPNPSVKVNQTGTTGGIYSISPAPGLPINATTGTIDPSGSTAGTYTVTYTIAASEGCSVYQTTAVITVNGTPSASIKYPPMCSSDGAVNVQLTGTQGGNFSSAAGLTINAFTGTISPSASTPGSYVITYTVPAFVPCPGFTTTTTVTINESPAITFPVVSQSVCSGQPAVFTPSSTVANTVYDWFVTGTLPSGVTGVISGSVSGANAAINLLFTNSSSTSVTLTIRVIPKNPVQSTCAGASNDLTLMVNPIPLALAGDTTLFCMHEPPAALTANADAGNTVKWYDANHVLLTQAPVISTTNPAQFIFYATQSSGFGCESPEAKFIAIVNPVAKIISSSYTNPTACGIPSGSIILNVLDLNDNPLPYIPVRVHYTKFQIAYAVADSTDGSGKIIIPVTAGTYADIYVETYGCFSQKIPDVFVLKDPTPPAQPVAGYNAPVCSETILNLTASSPTSSDPNSVSYVWAGPAFGNLPDTTQNTVFSFPSASTSYNGIYVVYAMQDNCISTAASFQVDIKQSPVKPVISTRTPLCIGDNLTLQASSSIPGNSTLNYVWNGPGSGFPVNAANAGIASVTVEDGGVYTITVTSPATGCSATTDTLIQVGGYPVVKFSQDSLTLPTGSILHLAPAIVNASEANILPIKQFEWTPMQNIVCNDAACSLPAVTVRNNICYTVKATNIYGCSGSDTICITALCKSAQVFIPNAFTPHGLATNSRFMVRASGIVSIRSFRVFNRWGKIVFEKNNFPPNDPAFGWDGYINGKLADMGVYVYTVDVTCENGIPYSYKGNVTLLQ